LINILGWFLSLDPLSENLIIFVKLN